MKELELRRAMVVASYDGLDEISISDVTKVTELRNGEIQTYEITPDFLGVRATSIRDVRGGDAALNAEIINSIFSGSRGAHRDIVLANTAACFYVTGRCSTLQEGVKIAANLIDSGKASDKLRQLVYFTGEVSHVS